MNKKILFCNCGGNLLKAEYKIEIFEALHKSEISIIKISDLCSVSIHLKKELLELISDSEDILIIACHQRAVKLILNNAGLQSDGGNIHFLNFLEHDKTDLIQKVTDFALNANLPNPFEIKTDTEWPAWYPLIDYARCSSCGQCADFCLFGVFQKKENKISVINPAECKNNCPACARICPQTAIIFPKYEHGGAIAGDESINELEEMDRQRKDINSILGSEIYQALEKRKLKRQSIIRNNTMQEALNEREKALNESKKN